jgi:pilus assembly protein Flp/PilA
MIPVGAKILRRGSQAREHRMRHLKSFFNDDAGATAIEYALIASLIAIALVTVLTNLGTQLSAEFSEVSSSLK